MRILDVVMRIVIWTAALSVILNGCTTINILNQRIESLSYIDSALAPYVGKFVAAGHDRGEFIETKHITVIFGKTGTDESPSTVGTCDNIAGYPFITIDRAYWSVADDDNKEELVFHELGHCVLNRDHCEVKENGASVSLMEPDMLAPGEYGKHREALVDELFNPHEGCSASGKNADGIHLRLR